MPAPFLRGARLRFSLLSPVRPGGRPLSRGVVVGLVLALVPVGVLVVVPPRVVKSEQDTPRLPDW